MDNMGLKKYIKNMNCGDVIAIKFEDECVEYITKTKWFEIIIFMLGGMGRIGEPIIVGSFYQNEDIDTDTVTNRIKELLDEDFNVEDDKGKITIQYSADEVFKNSGGDANFCYRKIER